MTNQDECSVICGLESTSTQVSRAAAELDEQLDAWRNRPIGEITYLVLDASYEKIRHDSAIRSCALLTAIGIDTDGKRSVIGCSVKLVASDDRAGLRAARQAVMAGVPWQRCHFHTILGGIAGWGFPAIGKGSTSMIVRFTSDDGTIEDRKLINGEQIADSISRTNVPDSEFAFDLGGRQLRYLRIQPGRPNPLVTVELAKGDAATAPIVMAIPAEMP